MHYQHWTRTSFRGQTKLRHELLLQLIKETSVTSVNLLYVNDTLWWLGPPFFGYRFAKMITKLLQSPQKWATRRPLECQEELWCWPMHHFQYQPLEKHNVVIGRPVGQILSDHVFLVRSIEQYAQTHDCHWDRFEYDDSQKEEASGRSMVGQW